MLTRQNTSVLFFIVLFAVLTTVQSVHLPSVSEAAEYLHRYGYLNSSVLSTANDGYTESTFTEALKDYQRYYGLNVTGELDDATKKAMSMPRCGVPDRVSGERGGRKKRFALRGGKIHHNNITYRMNNYPSGLNHDIVDIEVARAFALWSEVTDLTFTKKSSGPVDIEISFEKGIHDIREYAFDGENGVLGHGFYPSFGSAVHFDDDEKWSIGGECGYNFFSVAAHEFGHALGLDHSDIFPSLMFPKYNETTQVLKLHADDITGIQFLYGPRTPPGAPLPLDDDLCRDPKIDTTFLSNDGRQYVFKGNKYYENIENFKAYGYPKLISEGWPGLPDNIDAAFTDGNYRTYFFKGHQFWLYYGRLMSNGYPKNISETFPGLPTELNAALTIGSALYFFRDEVYYFYDFNTMASLPYNLTNLGVDQNNLDAAITIGNKVYIFKDDNTHQYAIEDNAPLRLEGSYKTLWRGCDYVQETREEYQIFYQVS